MASRSRKNMRSRRNKNSRRNRNRSRSQRGGLMLAPANANAPYTLLPEDALNALKQGAQFAAAHVGQHGGAAPINSNMALPSGMVGAAMQDKLLGALDQIKGMQDGGRRKSRKGSHRRRRASRKSRKAGKKSRKSRKAGKKSRKSRKASKKSRKGSRRHRSHKSSQRGGQAPANASYMTGVEAKGTHPQFNNFNTL